MKRSLMLIPAAALATVAIVVPTASSRSDMPFAPKGPVGVHIEPLSHGTIGERVNADGEGIQIKTRGPRDMLVTAITVDPNGSFGWHSHPGPVLVAVSAGTLTVYRADHSRCTRTTVSAGQAFVEGGGDVHLARNEGTEPVQLNAVFLARTGTTEFLTEEAQPRGCNF